MSEPDRLIEGTDAQGRPIPLVLRYNLGLDVGRLRKEIDHLLGRVPLIFEGTRQVALQIRRGSSDPWYESCYQEKDIAPEHQYDTVNPEIAGTYIGEVLTAFPTPIYRARLLSLDSRTCYSVHRDATARYHIAIQTSEHAPFVFVEQNKVFRVPADGNCYWLDTREVHTAMNGARDRRIHLVFAAEQ